MPFSVGQKICLWQERIDEKGVTVLKEVVVTLTETKTGVPGEWSGKPSPEQSLRGIGDDGEAYEKHWERWPESQTSTFGNQWSMRDDGEGEDPFWIPKEAVHAYNELQRHNDRYGSEHGVLKRTDTDGNPVLPKGDFEYCKKHDRYTHIEGQCFDCMLEDRGLPPLSSARRSIA